MTTEKDEHIILLLLKSVTESLTDAEQNQLNAWRQESETHERLYTRLSDPAYLQREYLRRRAMNTQRPLAEMQARIGATEGKKAGGTRWTYWAVAASVCVLIGLGVLLTRQPEPAIIAKPTEQVAIPSPAIKPGEQKATLTLTDGEKVQLGANEQKNQNLLSKHTPKAKAEAAPAVRQLCLDVPKGGEFKITLEDSTEVWINSDSKLIYPESFSKTERRVIVMGEAYFKVAQETDRPFYVETDGQVVRVYGTEFNIRSYTEDEAVQTTLVSGSISLSRLAGSSGELMLTPGHQAQFDKSEQTTFVKPVHTDVVTSWKDGRFVFEDQNLEQIMRDLSRWYNFDYTFHDDALRSIIFMGSIPRYANFDTVLAILEKSGGLRFKVEGNTIAIMKSK